MDVLRTLANRWPHGLISIGLWVLAHASLSGKGPQSIDPFVWTIAASFVATFFTWNWAYPTQKIRSFAVASLVLFGSVRSVDYALGGVYSAVGVWLVVFGLIFQLTREARKNIVRYRATTAQ